MTALQAGDPADIAQLRFATLRQPTTLVVTPDDIRRGFLELEQATLIEATTTGRYALDLSVAPGASYIANVVVSGGDPVEPAMAGNTRRLAISYRIELSPSARPGTYPWPISVRFTLAHP